MLHNLHPHTNEADLVAAFQNVLCGTGVVVECVHVFKDRRTGMSRRYAYVQFGGNEPDPHKKALVVVTTGKKPPCLRDVKMVRDFGGGGLTEDEFIKRARAHNSRA